MADGNRHNMASETRKAAAISNVTAEQQAEIDTQRSETFTTRRPTVPALEELLYRPVPLLDHGFVRVIDYDPPPEFN